MTMGMGIALVAIGAILRFAVQDSWDAVNLETVGVILMGAGAVGFVVGAIATFSGRAPTDRPPPPSAPQ
jgi:hypothetical protein